MVITYFNFLCFLSIYAFLAMSAKKKVQSSKQPATLAWITYSVLFFCGLVSLLGFIQFHLTMDEGGEPSGLFKAISPIKAFLEYAGLGALLFCVFGWRKSTATQNVNPYKKPAIMSLIAVLLMVGGMFLSALGFRLIKEIFGMDQIFLITFWRIICTGLQLAAVFLVNLAIFSGRDIYTESSDEEFVNTPIRAHDMTPEELDEDDTGGSTVNGELVQQFVLQNTEGLKTPNICPHCSEKAQDEVMLKSYEYDQPNLGMMLLFGLLGQLVVFLVVGFTPKELFKAKICDNCSYLSLMFRVLEWFVRIGSMVMVFALMTELSSKSRPLIQREVGVQLMVFSPLLFGWIFGLVFHNLAVKYKGITFQQMTKSGKKIYKAKSQAWYSAFIQLNQSQVKSSWTMDTTNT